MEASPSSRRPTGPAIVIFDPLDANGFYLVPDNAPSAQYLEAPSIQALVREPTSLPAMIKGLEIILADRFSTDARPGESKVYLPGCITPIRHQFRIQTLMQNLQTIPKFLALAVARKDWVLCRDVVRGRLVPSYLQTRLGIYAYWPDSNTQQGAVECEQTVWTALWHVLTTKLLMAGLEVVHAYIAQRFRTQIDLILAQLIVACGGPIVQRYSEEGEEGYGPTFELKFHLKMMDIAIAWGRAQYERSMALDYQSGCAA